MPQRLRLSGVHRNPLTEPAALVEREQVAPPERLPVRLRPTDESDDSFSPCPPSTYESPNEMDNHLERKIQNTAMGMVAINERQKSIPLPIPAPTAIAMIADIAKTDCRFVTSLKKSIANSFRKLMGISAADRGSNCRLLPMLSGTLPTSDSRAQRWKRR